MNTVKPIRDFAAAHEYLRQFHDPSHADYRLDSMRAIMEYLDNPQNSVRVVHVAGTSGKTSTAYYVSALLTAAGCKIGLTVSPHVDEMNERVQLNGRPIAEDQFCSALEEFAQAIQDAPVTLSRFECTVAFAYWYFAREKVDYAVVEVGLGGLLDGTNVVDRRDKVCVITDIGYDHMMVLGGSLREIAEQKFGIVGEGNSIFMYEQSVEIMEVARRVSRQQQSGLNIVPKGTNDGEMPDYQHRNWRLAHEVYNYIKQRDGLAELTPELLRRARQVQVPGRMDVRHHKGKTVIMDGAHNAQKMRAFVDSFIKLYPGQRPAVLIGMSAGKEYSEIIPILAEITDVVICTELTGSKDLPVKSVEAEVLARAFVAAGVKNVKATPDLREAVAAAFDNSEELVIITGSIYLLGQIRHEEFT